MSEAYPDLLLQSFQKACHCFAVTKDMGDRWQERNDMKPGISSDGFVCQITKNRKTLSLWTTPCRLPQDCSANGSMVQVEQHWLVVSCTEQGLGSWARPVAHLESWNLFSGCSRWRCLQSRASSAFYLWINCRLQHKLMSRIIQTLFLAMESIKQDCTLSGSTYYLA